MNSGFISFCYLLGFAFRETSGFQGSFIRHVGISHQPFIAHSIYAKLRLSPRFSAKKNYKVRSTIGSSSLTTESEGIWTNDDVEGKQDTGNFNFAQQWYPLAVTEFLDEKKPHPLQLMGKDLVAWKDVKSGQWKVFEDACPHRLAPLSEGRIEPDGTLLCAYHAWRFKADGKCTVIPQIDANQQEQILSSPRSCATVYQTVERQGLLWVWGEPGGPGSDAAIMSKLQPPQVIEELEDPTLIGRVRKLTWNVRDFPYGWDYFMENVVDFAHVSVAHHGLTGNRYTSPQPHDFIPTRKLSPQGGFSNRVDFKDVSKAPFPKSQTSQDFRPPCLVRIVNQWAEDDARLILCLYASPTIPGHCRHIGCIVEVKGRTGTTPKGMDMFTMSTPNWVNHIAASLFLHQDLVFLHHQEKILARRGFVNAAAGDGAKSVYERQVLMTKGLDDGVLAFRRWLRNMAGGGVPWAPGTPPLPPRQNDQGRLLSVWDSHTKNCAHCLTAVRNLKILRVAAAAAAVLVVGAAKGIVPVIAAAVLMAVSGAAHGLIGLFYKYEYSHAYND